MLSTGWPKLRFFCPRLFPAETPQKSPKVAISATTYRTLCQASRPIGQGVAAPRQQAAAQPWPPAPGSAPGWIRRTVARTRPMAGQRHGSSSTAAAARPKQPGNPGLRTALATSAGQWIERTAARTRPRAGQRHAQHAPGQGLATRTRQARPSLAGQGVALGWCCFAYWGA